MASYSNKSPFSTEIPALLTQHLEHLKASAISTEVIKERGYRSVLGKTDLKSACFSKAQQRAPGILIPLYSVDGSSIGYQYRPDNPRLNSRGKPIKYENPSGSTIRLDVPPRCKIVLKDPSVPIFFTEGVKKADALASQGACAVALNGIWGFKGKNSFGGVTILADFDSIALQGREGFVVYDSDIATNPQIRKAQDRLLEHLKRGSTNASAIYLPPKADGGKQGVDDFLAAGHTLDDLMALDTMPEEKANETRQSEYVIETSDGKLKLNLAKLVDNLLAEYHFATTIDTEEILVYENGVWGAEGEAFIKRECQRRVGNKELLTKYKVSEVIGHIQRTTYCHRSLFNNDKWILNLESGLLNIQNGELRPHKPQLYSTIRIPVKYNPHADCPKIKRFFAEVLKPEDMPLVEELFGYCLIPDYSIQRAFLFVGDGANGKSTLLNLMRKFIGKGNCASVPWHALELDRFAKSALDGKLVNMFADIPSQNLNRTGGFKMLTGGDAIGTEKKFKGYFTFNNYARLIFSANKPPKVVDEDSYAFWRRWIVIDFPNEFTGDRADKQLLEKLATEEELSGLLNLALNGLKRLLGQHDFSYKKSAEETTEIYFRAADPVYAFLEDQCEPNSEAWISKDELFQVFREYCKASKIPVKKPNSFARALQNQSHLKVSSVRKKMGDKQVTGWEGIKLGSSRDSKDSEVFPSLNYRENKNDSSSNIVNKIIGKNITNPTIHATKPLKTYSTCSSTDFWLRPDGQLVCNQCHPKPREIR